MNGVIHDHPAGPYCQDQAADLGAILHFEWNGKVDNPTYTLHPSADVLIDQHPHRAFFLAGTGQGLTAETGRLRLISVTFKNKHGWHDTVGEPPAFSAGRILSQSMWRDWLQGRDFAKWKADKTQRIAEEAAAILATKPVIKIVLPPSCIYRSTLTEAYPAIQ